MHPKLPASSNCLRVPFIFVPHGAPKPVEWMAAHPGWVSFPAKFRPRPMPASRDSADLETRSLQTWREEDQAPGMVPQPDWQRPDWQRPAAPPPRPERRPARPPVLGPVDAEAAGRHLGLRLSTPEGRAALLAETEEIRRYLRRFHHFETGRSTHSQSYAPPTQLEPVASTISPDYAAKMLGYDRQTFGDMIHAFKDFYHLKPNDNVHFHDNGDVFFQGRYLGSIHDFLP